MKITLLLTTLLTFNLSAKISILPQNNLYIPVDSKNRTNMTKRQFKKIINRVADTYRYQFKKMGGKLVVKTKWHDGTVNAFAEKKGKRYIVTFYGGLARHKAVTADGFALVVCHEFGHHLGGAPRLQGVIRGWKVSNEGQADYFAAQKCFKRVFASDDNLQIMEQQEVPPLVRQECAISYDNEEDMALCERVSLAGLSLSTLFSNLRNIPDPRFTTPDTSTVWNTWTLHPKPQCRLDTYFQGALCNRDYTSPIDFEDHTIGFCNRIDGDQRGLRPLCWFNPERY